MMKKTKHKYTAIDLFSGAGGLTQGLKQAGFNVVGAIESQPTYAESYFMNHPEVDLRNKDITTIDPKEYMNDLKLKKGQLDLLAGCPPCQGYSTIGTRNRGKRDDPRNELVYEVLRFAVAFRPKTIMMENVPALATDERLRKLRAELEKIGYKIDVKVLNMSKYDVPQARRRMIMLASRIGKLDVISQELDSDKMKTVRDAISFLPPVGCSHDPLHDIVEYRSNKVQKLISLVPKDGGSRTDLPEEYQLECHKKTSGFKDVYGRMSWDKPSPTITGGCSQPSKGRFLHPEENRTITLREAALLQTFPKNYKFSFKSGKQGVATMIGNALPPTFIQFHALNVVTHLNNSL
ncbi:MAG: DNA cytosine methyltransferase [Candidatus Nomurabacteria bacterium]|nr:DNA cytosine methyltransferase [Candidatus Nomurabacteria bacterium]